MKNGFQKLFTPVTIKGVEIKNRVVFLPHETHFGSEDHLPTKQQLYYYRERARGGVGLIIIPSMIVHQSGTYAHLVSAYRKESIPGLKEIVDDVHRFGAKIFGQLTHMGNQTRSIETQQPLWAPSSVPDMTVREIPKEMTVKEIKMLVESFALSAENLVKAGFDGINIKVGHDGILRQFLSPLKNKRTDQYGGSIENRTRIVLEVLKAVREMIGDRPLGLRLCINEYVPGGYGLEDSIQFIKMFAPFLDYISNTQGTWESMPMAIPPMSIPQGFVLQDVARIKKETGVALIGSGRIVKPEMAEEALQNGYCDMVGMARALIADPFWVQKAQEGKVEDIVECIGCNQKCIGRLLQNRNISCVVNPAAGLEEDYEADKLYGKADKTKKIVIIGGGPAGMKTAEIASRQGHEVVLFEKEKNLGGRINWESSLPQRSEFGGINRYLTHILSSLGVDTRTGVETNASMVINEKADIVVIASGATTVIPEIEGINGENVVFYPADVLSGKVEGKNVLVVDYDASPESAGVVELLLDQGKTVQWVTAVFVAGQDIDVTTLLLLYQRIGQKPVNIYPMNILLKFEHGTATLLNPYTGKTLLLDGIESIVATGVKAANNTLLNQLKDHVPQIRVIGDAAAPRDTAAALTDAMSLKID